MVVLDNSCQLCQALLASEFEAPGDLHHDLRNMFSRDQEICDACLETDFSGGPPSILPRLAMVLGYFVGILGMMVAMIASHLFSLGWSIYTILILGIYFGAPTCAAIIFIGFKCWVDIRSRTERRTEPTAYDNETKRFYLLSRWAELNGNTQMSQQMQRVAKRRGFVLND